VIKKKKEASFYKVKATEPTMEREPIEEGGGRREKPGTAGYISKFKKCCVTLAGRA
jgi:hypothetical protein